jgi:hypothetical protein
MKKTMKTDKQLFNLLTNETAARRLVTRYCTQTRKPMPFVNVGFNSTWAIRRNVQALLPTVKMSSVVHYVGLNFEFFQKLGVFVAEDTGFRSSVLTEMHTKLYIYSGRAVALFLLLYDPDFATLNGFGYITLKEVKKMFAEKEEVSCR